MEYVGSETPFKTFVKRPKVEFPPEDISEKIKHKDK